MLDCWNFLARILYEELPALTERVICSMNSQLQLKVPCLGRPFHLGMLYDRCTDELIPGINDEKSLGLTITNQSDRKTEKSVVTDDTFHGKSSSFGIGPDLMLSVLSGMVDVEGAAKFLHDHKSSEKQARVTLQYKTTSRFEEIQSPHILDKKDATHVVTGITYGADAFLVFDRSITEGESLDKVTNEMKVEVEKILSHHSSDNKTETCKFKCKFYGDFSPTTEPTTYEEALEFFKTLPTLFNDKCKPITAFMTPLFTEKSCQRPFYSIPPRLTTEVEKIMEHFHHTEVRASDLMEDSTCKKFIELRNQLINFRELLDQFKRDFVGKLSLILPKIHSAGAETDLEELISSFDESPFNSNKTKNYLDAKDSEKILLTDYLKKLKEVSGLQYDLPNTECRLSTLVGDNEIKHQWRIYKNGKEGSNCIRAVARKIF